jgi:hypothetical protein
VGLPAAAAATHEVKDTNSTPKYVWTSRESAKHDPTTDNKATVAGVVVKLFPRAKFVDHNTDLMHNEKAFTTSCNLDANI